MRGCFHAGSLVLSCLGLAFALAVEAGRSAREARGPRVVKAAVTIRLDDQGRPRPAPKAITITDRALDPDFRVWSEGRGDWRARPGLREYLGELAGAPGGPAAAGK